MQALVQDPVQLPIGGYFESVRTDLAFRNIPDITRFIQVHFLEDEAELLIATLRMQITSGLALVDAGVGYRIA